MAFVREYLTHYLRCLRLYHGITVLQDLQFSVYKFVDDADSLPM